jgi:UDP-N-acetylglucosamine transferase subunit ALG13
MILATVGVQLPFDRLIRAIDKWAGERNRKDVFAQIGLSEFHPQYIRFKSQVSPMEFRSLVEKAKIVVAHAGIGSMITALELGKPIIVMPRKAELFEHRNDHQMSTTRYMLKRGIVHVVMSEAELIAKLDQMDTLATKTPISATAEADLLKKVTAFLADCRK